MSSSTSQKRFRPKVPPDKRKRTALACIACRRRKRKCRPEESGICALCKEYQTSCVFETPPDVTETPRTTDNRQRPRAGLLRTEEQTKKVQPEVQMSSAIMNGGLMDDFPKTILQAVGTSMETSTPSESINDFDTGREVVNELLMELPLWSTANKLINAFFQYGESNWYYCDQGRFRRRLTSLYEHGIMSNEATPEFVSLTFMALAMGSHFQHLPTSSTTYFQHGSEDNSRLLGRKYFDAAQRLHSHLMQHMSIEGVQTTLLMALFLLPAGRRGSNYTFIGLSLRMAMSLSLHRLGAAGDSLTEESTRVFWTVWCLEKRFSLTWRAPDMLREQEIVTPMPAFNASLDAESPKKIDQLRAFIELTKLQDFAARHSTPSSDLEDVLSIEQHLESWNRNLPISLRSHEPSQIRATIHLQIMYHLIWLDFGRTSLLWLVKAQTNQHRGETPPTHASNPEHQDHHEHKQRRRLARLCASSARSVLHLIQSLRSHGMLASFSYTDFHACSSAVVLILLDSILHPREGLAEAMSSGIETLEILAARNEYAQRGVTLVKRFCTMLGKVAPELAIPNVDTTRGIQAAGERTADPGSGMWPDGQVQARTQAAMSSDFPIIDMVNFGRPHEDLTDTASSLADRQYDEADFAALEAIMGTDSDLWDVDQNPQDLYFFGFGGVGPSLL